MRFHDRLGLLLLIVSLLTGCSGKKTENPITGNRPDSLIPQGKMILILSDVHVVEAAFMLGRNDGADNSTGEEYYYRGIFNKYRITRSQFENSMAWYRQDPENYAKMYEKAIVILENRQKQFTPSPAE